MPLAPGETFLNQQKKSTAFITSILAPSLAMQLVTQNRERVAVAFSSDPAVAYSISLNPNPTDGQGIDIPANAAALVFTLNAHGALVFGPWYCASAAPPATITIAEACNYSD